jgi:hypothetical protein
MFVAAIVITKGWSAKTLACQKMPLIFPLISEYTHAAGINQMARADAIGNLRSNH